MNKCISGNTSDHFTRLDHLISALTDTDPEIDTSNRCEEVKGQFKSQFKIKVYCTQTVGCKKRQKGNGFRVDIKFITDTNERINLTNEQTLNMSELTFLN